MAEQGRREIVGDPLAFNPREQVPNRQLQTQGIRNPMQTSGSMAAQDGMAGLEALGSLRTAISGVLESKVDDWQTEGKMQYMQGVSEQEALASGNRYTQQGYEALSSVDKANTWYLAEQQNLQKTASMDPAEYKSYMMESRKKQLANLPADPAVRKLYIAAFDDLGPRLVEAQWKANNEYNTNRSISAAEGALYSGASANSDASRVMPNSTLRVSPTVVSRPFTNVPVMDRDILIKTMLGEAGGEGEEGLAAVAHVIKNRAMDKRWSGNLREVALQDKQFSTWNKGAGGNNPDRYKPGTPAYERAARVLDIVLAGKHVDPTGGATHYYSPAGMNKLVSEGSQNNLIPKWLQGEAAKSGGQIRLGNHIFVGRSEGAIRPSGPTIANAARISGGQPTQADVYQQQLEAGRKAGYVNGQEVPLDVQQSADPQSVAIAEGIPVAPPTGYKTQVQDLLENVGLSPENKSIALSRALVKSLDDGTDQLFNDAGGLGTLARLGADPKLIDQVEKAKDRYDKKELDKFDVSRERFRNDVLTKAKTGAYATIDEVFADVDTQGDVYNMSDSERKSLARQAVNDWNSHQDTEAKQVPVAMLSKLTALHMQIADQTMTAEEGAAEAQKLGKEFGVDAPTVQGLVENMFSRAETTRNKLKTEAEAAFKLKQKSDQTEAAVKAAISNGSGMKEITGNVLVNGKEVKPEQFAIDTIMQSERDNLERQIAAGNIKQESAPGLLYKAVYGKLNKLGIVDKRFGEQLNGALAGPIVQKNGQLTDGAKEAFDVYMQFAKDDTGQLSSRQFSEMVTDPKVRTLLATAETMYDGRYGMDDALLKASELINTPGFDPLAKVQYTPPVQSISEAGVREKITAAMETPGWFTNQTISEQDRRITLQHTRIADEYVKAQASIYQLQSPNAAPEALVKMAVEDLGRNAVVVGTNILIGRSEDGKRIDQVMGLDGSDRTLPQKAIEAEIMRNAEGAWGQLWKDRIEKSSTFDRKNTFGNAEGQARNPFARENTFGMRDELPPYYASYNPETGVVQVQLWETAERLRPIGRPMNILVKAAGARMREEMQKPSWLANQFRNVKQSIADTDFTTGLNNQGLPQ